MLLHVQLVTGLLSVRILKEENCLACYDGFYFKGEIDPFLKFPCRTKKTYGCMNNWKIVYI